MAALPIKFTELYHLTTAGIQVWLDDTNADLCDTTC